MACSVLEGHANVSRHQVRFSNLSLRIRLPAFTCFSLRSLAWAELYLILGNLLRKFDFEIHNTRLVTGRCSLRSLVQIYLIRDVQCERHDGSTRLLCSCSYRERLPHRHQGCSSLVATFNWFHVVTNIYICTQCTVSMPLQQSWLMLPLGAKHCSRLPFAVSGISASAGGDCVD